MGRPAKIHRLAFISFALPSLALAWWGCAKGSDTSSGAGGSSSLLASVGAGGEGGTTSSTSGPGTGGINVGDGGSGGGDSGACTFTSEEAHRVPLDLIFLIDRSGSMSGPKWMGTTAALTSFFNDPASADIGTGLEFFPTDTEYDCDVTHYEVLDVPIAPLPGNAFALTNSIPADATGIGTPMYGALKGVLSVATAYQDAHPTHKVNVVLATDGDPNGCADGLGNPQGITATAALAASALNYNGVHTYAIGVVGATITNLDRIAAAGGTTAAYDVTQDITQFAHNIALIRSAALGCNFDIPTPPKGKTLDPNEVNFSYTPGGMGTKEILPRASNLADCGGQPGWYYDDNSAPTNIILCPASCTTVQDDDMAKVSVLFGCQSIIN